MSDLPQPNPPAGSRFKGGTVRLLTAFLCGAVVMLIFGLTGVNIVTSLLSALAVAVAVFVAWVLIVRLYKRVFRSRA